MGKDLITDQLKRQFKDQHSFTRDDLLNLYLQHDPELKEATFRWRIYNLKAKKIITPISRGRFTLTFKPGYKPEIGVDENKLYLSVQKQFPMQAH